MAITCLTACNNNSPSDTTSPNQNVPYENEYTLSDDGKTLLSCLGQADENGKFVIPDGITMIAESAFAGDSTLKEVVIGPQVKVIGSGAFQYCSSLKTVTIAEGVETIGSHAFANCSSLKNISLPSTVSVLNESVFASCEDLESVSLDHIRIVGESAFVACTSLETATFSSKLESIGSWAFSQCSSLETITFEGVTRLSEIADYAFTGCDMLRSIDIPQGVSRIGILAFYDCSRLELIDIPDSVQVVDFGAFNYTPWYQGCNDEYLIVGDGVLIKCTVNPSNIDLSGKGIKMVGGTAFYNAAAHGEAADYGYKYAELLKEITIPDGVREIGKSAFAGCNALENITLNKDLVRIDSRAFNLLISSKPSSAKVNLEDCTELEYIGSYAFRGCYGIEELDLPDTVKSVGEHAFEFTKFQTEFMENASKATDEKDRYLIDGDILLFAYVAEDQTAIHVPDGVKIIAGGAFYGWDSIVVPDDVSTLIPAEASKYNITNTVTELYLPEGLEIIDSMAFYHMACVEKIDLPSSLRVIGISAFDSCTKLSDFEIPEGVQEINDYAFAYCSALKQIKLPETVRKIGFNIFSGCSSLKTVHLPKALENPGSALFDSYCSSLTQIFVNPAVRPRVYFVLGSLPQSIKVDYYK